LRIGIDLDGCLANFDDPFHALLIEANGGMTVPTVWPPEEWHWDRAYSSEVRACAWQHVKTSRFWADLPSYSGAEEVAQELNRMRVDSHDIYFITSRPGYRAKAYTEEWMKKLGVMEPTVCISFNKGAMARGLELDAFVDDKLDNIHAVSTAVRGCATWLLTRPHNARWIGYDRVTSVSEFLEVIRG
jgi:hypothetical protein